MSNFLCKSLLRDSSVLSAEETPSEDIFLYEVTVKRFFAYLENLKLEELNNKEANSKALNKFFFDHLFEMEFFSIKKTNHYENRIFAYDKSNKFVDEMRMKKYSYNALKQRATQGKLTVEEIE